MDNGLSFKDFRSVLYDHAFHTKTPLIGIFELTARCTLSCKFCYVHEMDACKAMEGELSTEQWKVIFSHAVDAGMLRATLTGGECLLRDDFCELYSFLYERGVVLTVKTNATLLTEELVSFFSEKRPKEIDITLYGSSNSEYLSLCGVPAFDRVLRAISLLRTEKIPVKLTTTIGKTNVNDAEKILAQLSESGLPYTVSHWLIPPTDVAQESDYNISNAERIQIELRQQKLRGRELFSHFDRPPAYGGTCTQQMKGMPCNAGRILFYVTYRGDMLPCVSIPDLSVSLLTHGFSDAWKEITERAAELLQPIECNGCVYEKKCLHCPLMRSAGKFSGHCNHEVCEYMQKKYSAGLIDIPST